MFVWTVLAFLWTFKEEEGRRKNLAPLELSSLLQLKSAFTRVVGSAVTTTFRRNRVAADIQGNGGDDFFVKTGLRFRIKLRFRRSLQLKQSYHPCFVTFGLFFGKRLRIKLRFRMTLRFRIKLRFKMNLRFMMNFCPKLHICYHACLGCLGLLWKYHRKNERKLRSASQM